jgi:hypothetical protein
MISTLTAYDWSMNKYDMVVVVGRFLRFYAPYVVGCDVLLRFSCYMFLVLTIILVAFSKRSFDLFLKLSLYCDLQSSIRCTISS